MTTTTASPPGLRVQDFEAEAMQHLDRMYAAAMRLTRSESDAEDLVQDAMLKAFRFHDRYRAGTNMKAWLLRILTNTFINKYRRKRRERDVFDGALATPVGEGVMSNHAIRGLTQPVEAAQRRMLASEIQGALESLPEDYRAIVIMADVEGLAYREIAEALECPIGTVMSRLHRARKVLRTQLVSQAEAMGIVDVPPTKAPISLNDYKRKKVAK